jgi:chemotaxis protein methyltransferase CheR
VTSNKKTMIQARLQKRMRSLGIDTIDEYCKYLFSNEGMKYELLNLIDAVTTNKTDFFRESAHFHALVKNILPEFIKNRQWTAHKQIKVWSAGCATGEEAYTLAMILKEFTMNQKDLEFHILATDVSTKALEEAKLGMYQYDKVEAVPAEMKIKYLLISKDRRKRLVRIVPELRKHVQFERVNFVEEDYKIGECVDIIFLRNVLIYFERAMHERILQKVSRYLNHGGYIFIGHAETLYGLNVPFIQVAPTIYRKVVSRN